MLEHATRTNQKNNPSWQQSRGNDTETLANIPQARRKRPPKSSLKLDNNP